MSRDRVPRAISLALAASLLALAIGGVAPTVAHGEEPTGLQAAAALEDVLVKAIAASERSVVAIARVRRANRNAGMQIDPFNSMRLPESNRPGDLDFIPNEYATGVVVGDGLILTANHVLGEDSDYWVTTADRKTYPVGRIVGADPRVDLAVLQIAARDMTPIKFGDASKLRKGQIVIALGNPFAIARDGQVSASWGIISNLARKDAPTTLRDELTKTALHQYGTLIQTDARLNLGTSGGALLNLQGEMIGLTMSLSATLGYEQSAGFALPVDETFRRALETLKQGREVEFGFLGVSPRKLSIGDRNSGLHGVVINAVVDGTPGQRAGLQPNDRIVRIGDQEIFDTDDLMLAVGKLPPDGNVQIAIYRREEPRIIQVQELAKFAVTAKQIITTRPPAWRGLHVDYVTISPEFRNQGNLATPVFDPQGSVLITAVDEGSPAWQEGLRANMTITHVAGHRVSNPKQFRDEVANKNGSVKVRLHMPPGHRAEQAERLIPAEAS